MDYLDTGKQLRHHIIIMIGYICIAVAIALGTMILLYQAYGFGFGKHGVIIQNSFAFFSSQPNPANIYVDGKVLGQTNTRLVLPSGIYQISLSRNGYTSWQRTVELDGGSVNHYDYPLLIPHTLITKKFQNITYASAPGLMTQSPDRRWLMVEEPGSMSQFHIFDLKNPTKPATDVAIPSTLLTKAVTSESWQLEEWADDNQHVVLQHLYDGKSEFVLVNRVDPAQSINLNTTLSASPSKLTLNNKKYDQYYLYNGADGTLQTATLAATTPVTLLQHILAYKTYGDNSVLYATDSPAPKGKVAVKLLDGNTTYNIHNFAAGTTYLLDLTKYSSTLYVAVGASSENKVYIYKDPLGQLGQHPDHAVTPTQVLHIVAPNYLSFSNNAQYIMAEQGNQFGVYDILNTKGFSYTTHEPLDAPQAHATWMDGNRLNYVSQGKLVLFDYDYTNKRTMMPLDSRFLPAYNPTYRIVFGLAPSTTTAGQFELTQTPLLIPADQ